MKDIKWATSVAAHDYDAAFAYLSVLLDPIRAHDAVERLRSAALTTRRVNDILRGCHREPLPKNDPGVVRNLKKIKAGEERSPILLVSFDYGGDIADGYHRVSAAYLLDPFAEIPCKMAHVLDSHPAS